MLRLRAGQHDPSTPAELVEIKSPIKVGNSYAVHFAGAGVYESAVAEVNAAVVDMAASAGIEKEHIPPTQLPAGQPGAKAGLLHGGAGDREAVFSEDIIDKA